jgi:hypothetical protein
VAWSFRISVGNATFTIVLSMLTTNTETQRTGKTSHGERPARGLDLATIARDATVQP